MLKLYIIGICILIIAILANGIIVRIGIKSWYEFIELISETGTETFSTLSIFDYIWLFLGYPLVLGLGYLVGLKVYNLIL